MFILKKEELTGGLRQLINGEICGKFCCQLLTFSVELFKLMLWVL